MHKVRPQSTAAKTANPGGATQLKSIQPSDKKVDGQQTGKEGTKGPCRYFLSETGCRKGQSCKWLHQAEPGDKRCYVCGATQHYAKE